jgi:hypothetical protein
MKPLFALLALLSTSAFAFDPLPDNFCESLKPPGTPPLAAPCTSAMISRLDTHCASFVTQVKDVEQHVAAAKTECNRVSTVATRRSGRTGRSEQSHAAGDTATMTDQNAGYMRRCAQEMGRYRDSYGALSMSSKREMESAGGCAPVKAGYEKMKEQADPRKADAQALADQYGHGASAADLITKANKKNEAGLGSAGNPSAATDTSPAEKKSGGGGGMPSLPQLPQMPQQKPSPPVKTAAQIISEQQAARQKECRGFSNTYTSGVNNCDNLHRCQPEIARVADSCNAYNACIAALAAVPSDCSGAPTPAQPK